MSLPAVFDRSPIEMGPVGFGRSPLELLGLGISAVIALAFTAYLLHCYFQEFWRHRRVRHRKRLSRLKAFPPGANRQTVIEGCRRRRDSVMAPDVAGLPELEWRGLHALIPSRDRITLVWDTGRAHEGALPRLCVETEAADPKTITGNGDVTLQ